MSPKLSVGTQKKPTSCCHNFNHKNKNKSESVMLPIPLISDNFTQNKDFFLQNRVVKEFI